MGIKMKTYSLKRILGRFPSLIQNMPINLVTINKLSPNFLLSLAYARINISIPDLIFLITTVISLNIGSNQRATLLYLPKRTRQEFLPSSTYTGQLK
ncbi:hypothetical protein HanIR_Chr10g0498611 [Helianthus annuus]|nr:hypothetical protein HanIR_Chr10g0498611 [Helianthus annuus]